MYVYVATTDEINAIFSPPQRGLKTNEIEHYKVLYFDLDTVIVICIRHYYSLRDNHEVFFVGCTIYCC